MLYQTLFTEAQTAVQSGNYAHAIALLQALAARSETQNNWVQYVHAATEWASVLIDQSQYDAACLLLQQIEQKTVHQLPAQHPAFADLQGNWGRYHTQMGNYQTAIVCFTTEQQLLANAPEPNYVSEMKMLGNLGWTYSAMHQYHTALTYFEQSLQIWQQHIAQNSTDLANLYNNIGICYNQKGDYEKELSYYHKAASVFIAVLGNNNTELMTTYGNIGATYNETGEHQKALLFFEQALQIALQTYGEQHTQTARLYNNMGYSYDQLQQYPQALQYHQKALHIRQQILGTQHTLYANSCSNIGLCYLHCHEVQKAIPFFEKALAIRQKNLGNQSSPVGITHNYLAQCYLQLNSFSQAIAHCQQAFAVFVPTFKPSSLANYPKVTLATDYIRLLDTFTIQVAILYNWQQHLPQKNYLKQAQQIVWAAIAWVDEIRRTYRSDTSKLLLAQKASLLCEWAVTIAFDIYTLAPNNKQLNQLFTAIEKGKAIVLLANITDTEAKNAAQIEPQLLQHEAFLLSQLTHLDNQINEAQQQHPPNEQQISQYQSQHFDIYQQYEQWITTIEQRYPAYHQIKFTTTTTTLLAVQQQLAPQTAFVSYFVSAQNIYILGIWQDAVKCISVPKPDNFDDLCTLFLTSINELQRKNYLNTANQLYSLLLKPILGDTNLPKNLILIPHAQLYYLPFEAMLTTVAAPNSLYPNLPYLIQQCPITYHYSATLWIAAHKNAAQTAHLPNNFVGFAPIYGSPHDMPTDVNELLNNTRSVRVFDQEYRPLWHSAVEVTSIAQLFEKANYPAQTFLYDAASIQNFKQYLPQFKYIHVAAHGIYQSRQPNLSGLVLLDDNQKAAVFYVSDSYHLALKSDLVVLSACESGIGKMAKGEGVLALNRGLLYAGAANIMYTLFKVFDKASSQLTQHFFVCVLNGFDYATALQNAKQQLITQNGNTPKSWAGFVLLGR